MQAHPFRNGLKIVDPKHLDGIRTYNGNPRTIRAMRLPRLAQSLVCWKPPARIFTSGKNFARGGVIFSQPVHTGRELVSALRGPHRMKEMGKG